ncbi:hypothetical protein OGAPHI_003849 [Ogataea philodendri]|uniref:Membrane insertase YidC/Oxa/ALB C-terminal domain-containing protein n=1 Tax=Ogataea philodendri TaxID=1378263 RepID=A0A9P8T593_9ASCO|nr:uncharacterized protein OGAPHI_003849 [Ogataea philodendri]KAH3665661.1 hypothetical protein OGAPHI_003849 [Ogataea philodendri]
MISVLRQPSRQLIGLRAGNTVTRRAALAGTGIRFNSTQTPEPPKFDTSLGFDTETVTNTLTSDQWGYLKSVGLCDGWWPSDLIQTALEAVHVTTGLPWWATIAATTIGLRLAFFPLFMSSSDAMARSQAAAPETKVLRKELNTAMSKGDRIGQQLKMQEIKKLNKKYGVKYSRMFLSPGVQFTYGIGSFFGIREMANLPVQGFENQGIYWFPDLTAPDPYIGLQLISACLYAISFKFGGETAINQFSSTTQKMFMALPFVSIVFTWNLSSAVLVYFTANGVFSIIQARLLRTPSFRKVFNMYPLQKPAAEQTKGMMENFSDTWKEMQENSEIREKADQKAKNAAARQLLKAKSQKVIIEKRE